MPSGESNVIQLRDGSARLSQFLKTLSRLDDRLTEISDWIKIALHEGHLSLGKRVLPRLQRVERQLTSQVDRQREDLERQRLVEKANLTPARVMDALTNVAADGPVQAMHVAIAILPELSDPAIAGRQRVITDVSRHLRELAKAGKVTQIRPSENEDRRKTCRYAVAASGGRDGA